MRLLIGIENFFNEVSATGREKEDDKKWQDLLFICSSEFGWTERDLCENVSAPFLLDVLNARKRKLEADEREMRKSKRR